MNKKLVNKLPNYAFIDAQNLYLGVEKQGWSLDYKKFRVYLKEKYNVEIAYLFIGYLPENNDIYIRLQSYGYILIHKEALKINGKSIKGNCDAELVLQAMIDLKNYDKAVLVSGDGDFACLVKFLFKQSKLEMVIVPNSQKYSILIKKTAKNKIDSLTNLKNKLQTKKSSTDKD